MREVKLRWLDFDLFPAFLWVFMGRDGVYGFWEKLRDTAGSPE